MAINTTAIQNLLRPGLAAVFGDYPQYPAQWSEFYAEHTSDKNFEQEVEVKLLGLAAIRQEGASTFYDNMGQRYLTNYVHRYVSIGFVITRQAQKDNLYKGQFPVQATAMKNSMAQAKETLGAAVLNNGFSSSFPVGDGKPVFSTTHPLDSGVLANTFSVVTDFNETSLQSAIVLIQQFKDLAGLRTMARPRKLIVAPQNQWAAERVLHSAYRTDSANNDISAVYNTRAVPEGYRVNQFLTSNSNWFLFTDAPNGFKHYEREPIETDVYIDFDTDNLKAKAVERYSFGVSNVRAGFGAQGSF